MGVHSQRRERREFCRRGGSGVIGRCVGERGREWKVSANKREGAASKQDRTVYAPGGKYLLSTLRSDMLKEEDDRSRWYK